MRQGEEEGGGGKKLFTGRKEGRGCFFATQLMTSRKGAESYNTLVD